MSRPVVRDCYTEYNSDDFGIEFLDPSLTKQGDKKSCDINLIVKRWMESGTIPSNLNEEFGQFLDVADIPDFKTCQDFVIRARGLFEQLPIEVRERFRNDPGEFLAFAENPDNGEAMVEMGLAVRRGSPEAPAADAAPPMAGGAPSAGGGSGEVNKAPA